MAKFKCASCRKQCGFVNTTGRPDRDIAAWKERDKHECADCRASKHAEDAQIAAESAAADGLPALSGSPAQIVWAEQLRARMLQIFEAAFAIVTAPASLAVMRSKSRASWWITHRTLTPAALLLVLRQEIDAETMRQAMAPTSPEESAAEAEAIAESLLIPEGDPVTSHVVELRHVGDTLHAMLQVPHEAFNAIVKRHEFRWLRFAAEWRRTLHPERSGRPEDRLAQIASDLLAAGFIVQIHDETARQMAADGTFQPERTRWVDAAPDGWLSLHWRRMVDDLYEKARQISGSRYRDGCVCVPIGSADEAQDFAQAFGFAFTGQATALISRHMSAMAAGRVVSVTPVDAQPVSSGDAFVPPRLAAPIAVEIDQSLRDD